jgi:hypothetical protein
MGDAKTLYRFLNVHVFASDVEVKAKFMLRLNAEAKSEAMRAPRERFIKAILAEHKKARALYEACRF